MAGKYNKFIGEYEKIGYSSFLWKFGTTSFRTKEFNRMTEWQLRLLEDFWQKSEYANFGWENKYKQPGQADIYWIKCRYYDWLVENGFMVGGEPENIKYKTAREKTSGLFDMGLINENRRLTEVGKNLLELSANNNFNEMTQLNISNDSMIYLQQLLKLSSHDTGNVVRPFIVVLYLLTNLEYLSLEEFRYLMPLCTDRENTEYIVNFIKELRNGSGSIDDVIINLLMSKDNYKRGHERFVGHQFSENLLLSISMNRKSPEKYDKNYVPLYEKMRAVYMNHDNTAIIDLFQTINKFQHAIKTKWKHLLFDTSNLAALKKEPETHLNTLPNDVVDTEEHFKSFFFKTMHLYKAKATLEDYLDLNRRYLGLTNCFVFEDDQVRLDIVPKQLFRKAMPELYEQAYCKCQFLERCSTLEEICPALSLDEKDVIEGINKDLNIHISTIEEANSELDRIKYQRFEKLVEDKFSNEQLITLLGEFENREDDSISHKVTDNADIPTIFEFVLGIIWWKISDKRGKILDFMKLSLDANLLPITHAAGGEADIVYEYTACADYPCHSVLLEATLANRTTLRRMEMEPVSRHVGNHILRTGNKDSYGVFATTFLHLNVISDFKSRKNTVYFDTQDETKYISGMKIIPLITKDLKNILTLGLKYKDIYNRFERAYNESEKYKNPKQWYDEMIEIV